MAEPVRSELCIIGAGALGIAVAKYAQSLGVKVVLVARGAPESGDNPHLALHLAALSESARLIAALRNGQAMGLSSVDAKISVKAAQERAALIVKEARGAHEPEHFGALGIEYVAGPTRFLDQRVLMVGDTELRPVHTILALGADWVAPSIPGLNEIDVFTPETLLANTRKLSHLLIIGGDGEGLTIAQIYARLGSLVTVVPQGDVLPGYDREAVNLLLADLRQEGVRVLEGAYVQSIHPRAQGTGATVAHPNGDVEALDLSHVAIAGARQANSATLELDKARVRVIPGMGGLLATGASGETTHPRIRAIGYASGINHWQAAYEQGRAVVRSLVDGHGQKSRSGTARLVPTEPELIEIGKVPSPADAAKSNIKVLRSNLAENELAVAAGKSRGLIKVFTAQNGVVVGASVVGPGASEISSVLSLAVSEGLPVQRLASLSSPHLSYLSNIIRLAANQTTPQTVSWGTAQLRNLRKYLPW